jgi:tRNA-binding EMAP/Myf-like protein
MTAIVMQVIKAEKHPYADSLRVYEMEALPIGTKQIIANLENIYEVGDKAIVVLSGSVLKDGTKISDSKIRNVYSYGMALGKSTAEIGTDLSAEYCVEQKATFIPWPDIESLFNVRKSLNALKENIGLPKVIYRAKIKIDGTNAAVQIYPDGTIYVQSRSNFITPEKDNVGFAKWVNSKIDIFKSLAKNEVITVFGEFCGPGIQKGTAINDLKRKILAVFAVQSGNSTFIVDEIKLNELFANVTDPDIHIIGWYGDPIEIDYGNTDNVQAAADKLNSIVASVEYCDPWVDGKFGVKGIGEGVVLYPVTSNGIDITSRVDFSDLMFKAKGEAHRVVKQKKPVQINPETANNVKEFVDMFLTSARLEQGVTAACGGQYDLKLTGTFVKWVSGDVFKESSAELEASGLVWNDVAKDISNTASGWYREAAKKQF